MLLLLDIWQEKQLGIHVVEDGSEDCIGQDSNKDSDGQGPGFWKSLDSWHIFREIGAFE